MASRKLEKIAREYRIDPSTLPPVDGKSVTYNITEAIQTKPPSQPVIESKEARQSERDRRKAARLSRHQ